MEEEQLWWMRYNMNYTIFLSDTAVITKAAGIRWLGHVIQRMRHLHLNASCSLNPRLQTSRATKQWFDCVTDDLANIYVRKWRRGPNTEKGWKILIQPRPTMGCTAAAADDDDDGQHDSFINLQVQKMVQDVQYHMSVEKY